MTDPTELVEPATQLRCVGTRFPGFTSLLEYSALVIEGEIEEQILWDQFLQSRGLHREKVKNQSEEDATCLSEGYYALLRSWGIVVPKAEG